MPEEVVGRNKKRDLGAKCQKSLCKRAFFHTVEKKLKHRQVIAFSEQVKSTTWDSRGLNGKKVERYF